MQTDLLQDEQSLFDKLCSPFWLGMGFSDVKKNQGASGVDGVSVDDFAAKIDEELSQLAEELVRWTYKPSPVRGIEIAKPDGGVRLLGIPTVRDRVVQATLKRLLEPIILPTFSDHSFGFIPGRNQEQAVREAQRIVAGGKPWVADIDLAKFFDRIHHDRLIARLGNIIDDKRILRLVGLILRSGVMKGGLVTPSQEGSVQGSPLSPLLSNVVLDELDKELESRGLSFCRYADDCNIFLGSQKSARRVMGSITKWIERKLRLEVNQAKSQVARSDQVTFLGMTIVQGHVAISLKSMNRAMAKVKALTPRGTHLKLEDAINVINRWYRGWSEYYKMTQYPSQLSKIEAHIRRRLRARLVDQQKSRRNLFYKLMKRYVPRRQAARAAFSHDKRWALSHRPSVEKAYPNQWFIRDMKLFVRSTERHKHWFDLRLWKRLM